MVYHLGLQLTKDRVDDRLNDGIIKETIEGEIDNKIKSSL
jgi:hypothetical protein